MSRSRGFGCGLLAALAASTRLYFVAAFPVLLGELWWRNRRSGTSPAVSVAFLAGLGVGFAPQLFFVASAAQAYWYDHLLYHLTRSSFTWLEALIQKLGVVLLLANVQPAYDAVGGQFALLAFFAILLVVAAPGLLDHRFRLAAGLIVALGLVCLAPSPSFTQYFTVCVPYLIVLAVGFYDHTWAELSNAPGSFPRSLVRAATALFLALYVAQGAFAVYRYTVTGTGVAGLDNPAAISGLRLPAIRQVSRELNRLTRPGEPVASFWPGYLVECHCGPVSGFENQFALGLPLEEAAAERYRVFTPATLPRLFETRPPRLAVLGNSDYWGQQSRDRAMLLANGYERIAETAHAEIYAQAGRAAPR